MKILKFELEQLFKYLSAGNIDSFKQSFRPDFVNAFYTDTIYAYDYSYYTSASVKKKEVQHRLLIFEAMLKESYEAFGILLDHGADLLLQETFETFDYISNGLNAKPDISKTDIAIICISNSKNPKFIQMTFDHICAKRLYEKPIFVDFMIRHLKEVSRDKFNPKFLNIDVGSPLPCWFETVEEYRAFLIKADIDITGIFFTKEDYFVVLTDPVTQLNEFFLNHALQVCNFTSDEFKIIHQVVQEEYLKRVVENWSPELNPDFVQALDLVFEEKEQKKSPPKRARSGSLEIPEPSQNAIKITTVHRQDYEHLIKRIAYLEQQEEGLRKKIELGKGSRANKELKKEGKKSEKALKSVLASLKDCKSRFYENPCYTLEKEVDKDDLHEGHSAEY